MLRVVYRREPIEIRVRQYIYPALMVHKVGDGLIDVITNEVELLRFLHDTLKYDVCADYYFKYEDKEIFITPLGELTEWPEGMYDESQKTFAAMLPLRKAAALRAQEQPPHTDAH